MLTEGYDLKPGDLFRFENNERIYVVTDIVDNGIQLEFYHRDTGTWGYTLLPQKLVKLNDHLS